MPLMMRSSLLLSTSKVKRKLPVQAIVPINTSPVFSLFLEWVLSSKNGCVSIVVRVPRRESITFLPNVSGVSLMCISFAQLPLNSVR